MTYHSARRVQMNSRGTSRLFFALFTSGIMLNTWAEDEAILVPTLEVITTGSTSERISQSSDQGVYELTRKSLEHYSSVNGDITDAIETLPNVQLSDDADSTSGLTDLKPASVSISGGRYYDNNFSINGISNNSLLDPAGSETSDSSINEVPGHEQAIFLDLDQIDSIRVYDSNIPAEYGSFTGGVIDAKIREASDEQRTRFSYYTTRSEWVKYHVIINDIDDEDLNYDEPEAAEFSRSRFTISHERPLNDDNRFRISFSGSQSSTPTLSLNQTEQIREEKYSLSVTHTYEDDIKKITNFFSYSPYKKNTLLDDVKDSDYELTSGGLLFNSDTEALIGNQIHWFTVAANYSENSRSAPGDYRTWYNTTSKDWGSDAGLTSSKEGAFGDLDKYQAGISLNWKSESNLRSEFAQKLRYGATIKQTFAGFSRPEDTYIFSHAEDSDGDEIGLNPAVECLQSSLDCAQGEQFFSSRLVYPEDSANVSLGELAAFAELTMKFDRLSATIGGRIDHDNFLNNTNIGWRSRASYDFFNDRSLMFIAGANRYYSGPLLTYKLREAAEPYYEEYRSTTNNVINSWEYDSGAGTYRYRFDDTRTPYSDEVVLAIKGILLGGTGEVKLLQRNNEDEFSRSETGVESDGYRYYEITNDGYSNYESISINWDADFGHFNTGFSATWSRTESSNNSYDDSIDPATSDESVWYQGERRTLASINQLRENYARPVILSVYGAADITDWFTATLKAKYKGSYATVVDTGDDYQDGITDGQANNMAIYEDSRRPASLIVDSSFRIRPVSALNLTLVAEINNIFNARTYSVAETDDDGIEVGRSVWLGVEAEF